MVLSQGTLGLKKENHEFAIVCTQKWLGLMSFTNQFVVFLVVYSVFFLGISPMSLKILEHLA